MARYSVRLLDLAEQDLLQLLRYTGRVSPEGAAGLAAALKAAVDSLEERPRKYPVYERQPVFRKMVVRDVLVFYTVGDDPPRVDVHRILHGRRELL